MTIARQADAAVVAQAAAAVRQGKLIVLPTDTCYGIGASPFSRLAVGTLNAAKHRGSDQPPAVLVSSERDAISVVQDVGMHARILMRHFWPGPLTIIVKGLEELGWQLGQPDSCIALRVPDDGVALAVLSQTGPLAVSAAAVEGHEPGASVHEVQQIFHEAVEVYLDAGPRPPSARSTIVQCLGPEIVVLRKGPVSRDDIQAVSGITKVRDEST